VNPLVPDRIRIDDKQSRTRSRAGSSCAYRHFIHHNDKNCFERQEILSIGSLADSVRCTHGATSGQIAEEELFYLHSRGIPTKVSQRLDHQAIGDYLNRLIEEKFAQV
jgi:hypothetical protein